jgi:hypothetical protein
MPSKLTAPERQVLGVLKMERDPADRTLAKIAALSGLSEKEVGDALRQLESHEPPLVHQDRDATLEVEFWIALERSIAALEGAEGWENV